MFLRTRSIVFESSTKWSYSLCIVDLANVASICVPSLVANGMEEQKWDWTAIRFTDGSFEIVDTPFSETATLWAKRFPHKIPQDVQVYSLN